MKAGPQLALAIGAGYLLGRKRRLRWALVLAAAGATGRMGGASGALVSQLRRIGSESELGEIAGTVRGPLLQAGKAAVLAAVGSRLESVTDSLQERAGSLSVPAPRRERDEREEPEEDELEDEELDEDEPEDEELEDEDYPEEEVAEEEPEPRRDRRRASSGRSPVRRSGRR